MVATDIKRFDPQVSKSAYSMPDESTCRSDVKPRPFLVTEYARFRGWTSEQAHALILYKPNTDKIVFLKIWGQKKRNELSEYLI